MSYKVEIHNRIKIGFAIGWSYYSNDKEHKWNETNIYIGLIGITIKKYET